MNQRTVLIWFKFLGFKSRKNIKSVSLVELIICIVIMGIMFLSFYSFEEFSNKQVLNSDRRTKVQNSLAYCLEYMGKYVQQAGGNINISYPAITLYPAVGMPKTGFQLRVDFNNPQTPENFADDALVYYTLAGNTLSTGCTGSCGSFAAEALSTKIVANFTNALLPANPPNGFYVVVDPLGNSVDIGLVGRYYPLQVPTAATRLTNPQIAMKTRLVCNNSSTN
jgi:Tfp pilus assembly protein PilE